MAGLPLPWRDAGTKELSKVQQQAPSDRQPLPLARHALSIRSKGAMVIGALLVYAIVISLFAFDQKNQLLREFEEIQSTLQTEALLKQADLSAFHAVIAIFAAIDANDPQVAMQHAEMYHQSLLDAQRDLGQRFDSALLAPGALDADWQRANQHPDKPNLNRLLSGVVKVKSELSALTEAVQRRRQSLAASYRERTGSVASTIFAAGMLGLVMLGACIVLFFRRLTEDLAILQKRALEILHGLHGGPISVTRHDEVGQLMTAVNNMSDTLEARNKELMLERQKYMHQEKMAAIGTLAAGISHEIGNPIAAISGIAQDMLERRACMDEHGRVNCCQCRPDLIYEQTSRLAAITREIADFASPRAVEAQLLDLNHQLRSTTSLVRYDKRLAGVELQLQLDTQLPAIHGVADQLTQLIMNLLINAMDALEGVSGRRRPTITVTTSRTPLGVQMCVEDNGSGMDAATVQRVFEAFFTTKPAGKGTGLGLSLCYAIAQNHGGTIDIESAPERGTQVRVLFPPTE
jgi:signal transduction histidine kinase